MTEPAVVAAPEPQQRRRRGTNSGGDLFGARGALAFIGPAAIVIAIFLLVPALWTLYLGLTNRTLTGVTAIHPEFVGLENYRDALSDEQFWRSFRATLQYVIGSAIIGQAVLGFTLAWIFRDWHSWVRRALELLIVFAWIIPGTVVARLWRAFLDEQGTLNLLLPFNPRWLIDHEMLSIVVANTWRGTAFSMLLFGAALNSLPPSYLETARLAGASTWQQLTGVVLPSIKGYILTNLLLISLWTFNDFGPFLLIGGGLGRRTEVLPVYLYYEAFRAETRFGYGAAIAAIIMAINLVIASFYLRAGEATRMSVRSFASRVAFAGFASLIGLFFALPMLWLVFAPFNTDTTLAARPSRPTLENFHEVFIERTDVPKSLGISVLLVIGVVTIVVLVGAPAAYALSRIRFPGRDTFLYLLLLMSSVVAGSAAILPLYLLMFELGLIDTYQGIWLALAGGLLPAAMFILKDFTDSIPRSYEESARVFGASSLQALRHIVVPVIRPGLAVIGVWTAVQVWGSFLVPYILFGGPGRRPAAVLMYTFQDEGGGTDLGPLAAFALVYTIPILVLYWFVNKRYGFRFHGGIKR